MAKLIDTTELTDEVTSFRTEFEIVDTTKSLQERYDHYKTVMDQDNESPAAATS